MCVIDLCITEAKPTKNWNPPARFQTLDEKAAWFLGAVGIFLNKHIAPGSYASPGSDHGNQGHRKRSNKKPNDGGDDVADEEGEESGVVGDEDKGKGAGCDGRMFRKKQNDAPESPDIDGIRNYASNLLWYGLFFRVWDDSVHEGDGPRVIRNWRIALLLFRAWGRHKYCVEQIMQQAAINGAESERVAQMLTWCRFWNGTGCPGCNISLDLHCEFCNKIVKHEIRRLGANFLVKGEIREGIAEMAHQLSEVGSSFDRNHTIVMGGRHTDLKYQKRVVTVTRELVKGKVWNRIPGRHYAHFKNMDASPLACIDFPDLERYIGTHIRKIAKDQRRRARRNMDV
jgi:hypothetical protein